MCGRMYERIRARVGWRKDGGRMTEGWRKDWCSFRGRILEGKVYVGFQFSIFGEHFSSLVHGTWSMVDGPWTMVHGPWSMDPWSMVHGPCAMDQT